MSAAVNKLKSNSGATLLMALLFFAICAATGSMILLSATAASGRLSMLGDTDQNYYAVRSATKMVEEMLTSEYIEAREVLTIVETTTHESGEDEGGEGSGEGGGDESGDDGEEVTIKYTYEGPNFYLVTVASNGTETRSDTPLVYDNDHNNNGIMVELLSDSNISNYHGEGSKLEANVINVEDYPYKFDDVWFKSGSGSSLNSTPVESLITVNKSPADPLEEGAGDSLDELSVDMKATMDSTGLLTIEFENHGSGIKNKYKMILKMQADGSRKLEETETEEHNEDKDIVTTVKTRVYKFKLTPVSIDKG